MLDSTGTEARARFDEKRHYDVARQLNADINKLESSNGQVVVGSRPLSLGFDISSACNVNCIFCLAEGGRKRKADPKAFRSPEWLDNFEGLLPFIRLGVFSSYEALLNPDFDKFVLKMRQFYTPFQIFTNGMALTPEISRFCLENGMQSLHCSMHSPDPETCEGIMRGLKFDTVLANLMSLKVQARAINPDFTLVMVFCAMRRNIEQLPAYVDLAARVGAKVIQVNHLLVTNEKHGLDHESMFFHKDMFDAYVHAAQKKAAAMGIRLQHQPTFSDHSVPLERQQCFKPWESLNVRHNGDVTICCGGANGLGNIFENDFFSVWNNKSFRTFRRLVNSPNPPAACRKCTRGREDPNVITTHLTYLRSLDANELARREKELWKALEG